MVYPVPGANALNVANGVRDEMARLSAAFPADLTYEINYDSTLPVTATLHEIAVSLTLTLIVVLAVVYLFTKSARDLYCGAHGSGLVTWHLCCAVCLWLFSQYSQFVRYYSGPDHCGG